MFIHGVGGPTSDWHEPLTGYLIGAGINDVRHSTVRYDDLLQCRQLIIRATRDLAPIDGLDDREDCERSEARCDFMVRRTQLADLVATAPDGVSPPWVRPPPLILGEAMVRLPLLNMRQAGHYRHNAGARDAVLNRLAEQLRAAGDDVIVVAHSLGSVIALDALHARDVRVGLLVTIGSPLGLGRFWCQRWAGDDRFPHHRLGAWLNVVNLRDPVPWQRGIARRFPAAVDSFIDIGAGLAGLGGVHDPAVYTGSGPARLAVQQHLSAVAAGRLATNAPASSRATSEQVA